MSFDGFVRISNNSGEEYEDAQVRLVVGTINLVEKIAQLAQIPDEEVALMQTRRSEFRPPASSSHVDVAEQIGNVRRRDEL